MPEVRAYQIWSTVLGKALTEVSPSGAKISTSVYAGGTHIAKQTENGVEWSTADPVTGTVGKFVFTAQGSATDVENTEPLGQKIHPHDPAEYTPPTGTVMIGNADYPEWQCEAQNAFILYGEFQEWPMPCQQRYAFEMSVMPVEYVKQKKQNPVFVNQLLDSPAHGGKNVAAPDRGLAYAANKARGSALRSSAKSGEEGGDSGCDWDKDGKPNCTVTVTDVPPLIESDTGVVDANLSAVEERVYTTPTSADTYELIALEVATAKYLLKNFASCRDLFGNDTTGKSVDPIAFIDSLLASDNNIGSIRFADLGTGFNAGVDDLGYTLTRLANGTQLKISRFGGVANITLNTNSSSEWVAGYNNRFGANDFTNRVITLIHELGHAAVKVYGEGAAKIVPDSLAQPAISRKNSLMVFENCVAVLTPKLTEVNYVP